MRPVLNNMPPKSAHGISEQIHALRDGTLKSRDIVESCLRRIGEQSQINAVVELDERSARAMADRADKAFAAGEDRGPLAGIPFTVKRLFRVGRFEPADSMTKFEVPLQRDAAVVEILQSAGAILLGRTNAPHAGEDIDTVHPVHGRTINPTFPHLSPGGSSGGSAAAVAAEHSLFDVGSDVSGSVRLPAHCCEITGFRPTSGVIPAIGHRVGPAATEGTRGFLTPGLLARSAADLLVIWQALTSCSGAARTTRRRLAVCFTHHQGAPDETVVDRLRRAVLRLRDRGIEVDEVDLPVSLGECWLLYQMLLFAGPESTCDDYDEPGPAPLPGSEPLDVALWAQSAATSRARDWDQQRTEICAAWDRFLDEYEALLLPVTLTPGLPRRTSELPVLADTFILGHQERPMFEVSIWCALASLAGLPAVVTPVERTDAGEPVGVQVVGARGGDLKLLELLGELEPLLNARVRT